MMKDDAVEEILDVLHNDLLSVQERLLKLHDLGVVFDEDSLDERILKVLVQLDLLDNLRIQHGLPRQF
ncbi:MAG: hypothetical protein JKY84_12980 [Emcibacteraceae bacterium]|nr:hypothetical protein [Emcibacteraceae bacterium]